MTEYEKNIFKEYLHNKSKIIQFKIIVYIVFINVYFILRVNVGDRLMWIDVLFIIIEVLLLLFLIAFSKKYFVKNVFQAIEKKQMMIYSGIICDKKIENKARTTPDYVISIKTNNGKKYDFCVSKVEFKKLSVSQNAKALKYKKNDWFNIYGYFDYLFTIE